MSTKVEVPALGESITEATLVRWLKNDGDEVAVDDALCELETDKATVDLPSPAAGVLQRSKNEGDTVRVGEVIAEIGAAEAGAAKKKPAPKAEADRPPVVEKATPPPPAPEPRAPKPAPEPLTAPPVEPRPVTALTVETERAVVTGPGQRRVPMTRIRKKIAQRLVAAQHTAAMLTTFNEVDMHTIMDLRARYGEKFKEDHGVSLGFMSFFARAVCVALEEYPVVNAFIDGEDIVYNDGVNLGIAVSTDRGLVVPVLHHAERMSFADIEKNVRELATAAREGKLGLDALGGGTFTITNGGVFGSLLSTPILNSPQSAILGMHAIQKRPKVLEDDRIVARPMMYVALSYDHRLIDGRDSVRFLVRVKEYLEDPARMVLGL